MVLACVWGRLEDSNFGLATRWECIIRWPSPSSPEPKGDDPRFGALVQDSRPKAESCKLRSASEGIPAFFGDDEGGDSRPNLVGIDAATGPCLAMYEMP